MAHDVPRRRLPVLGDDLISSLDPKDGKRRLPVPADVRGRFARARRVAFAALVAIWIAAPLLRVGGRPLILLDIARRRFFVFGQGFGVEDVHLLFFVMTGAAFALLVATAVLGRVFCGWACPQTVFLEGIFRPIERFIEGPREPRMRRDRGKWTLERVLRKTVKHLLFLTVATLVSHATMSLFITWPGLIGMAFGPPSLHPQAFGWAVATTAAVYLNFAFFREQVCLVLCPYGRLQAALVDRATLVVGYDTKRGEPRGKVSDQGAGDCVDCNRCVVVCPTGIDIRNGLQLDCLACTACIDACDEVMDRVRRPRGLVRYDSQEGFDGERRRILRPRLAIYAVLGLIGLGVGGVALGRRDELAARVLRAPGAPYVVEGDRTRNSFILQIANREDTPLDVEVEGTGDGLEFAFPQARTAVPPMGQTRLNFVVSAPRGQGSTSFSVIVIEGAERTSHRVEGRFVAP